jgi:hypothetical protein
MHSQTKDGSVVVYASAARAALLSQQMCILLLIIFLVRRSSVHLRIVITSEENSVERLPIGMLFYIRDQEYLHQSSCEFPTHL